MDYRRLSKKYNVRKLDQNDVNVIYQLCATNPMYYQYCPPFVKQEMIIEDLQALPENTSMDQKYYLGYFLDGQLIAVIDLILGYPNNKTAFIGFFMTGNSFQGKGISTGIITELVTTLKKEEYEKIQLAWVKGNTQAEHFWKKNQFVEVKETKSLDDRVVILAERNLYEK